MNHPDGLLRGGVAFEVILGVQVGVCGNGTRGRRLVVSGGEAGAPGESRSCWQSPEDDREVMSGAGGKMGLRGLSRTGEQDGGDRRRGKEHAILEHPHTLNPPQPCEEDTWLSPTFIDVETEACGGL